MIEVNFHSKHQTMHVQPNSQYLLFDSSILEAPFEDNIIRSLDTLGSRFRYLKQDDKCAINKESNLH